MEDASLLDSVVVPLDPHAGDQERLDPWRLLAEQKALLVSWADGTAMDAARWGPALGSGSALGRQLSTVLEQAGRARQLTEATSTVFRVEVPTGSTLQDLVPAIGGGFRGLVRTADKGALTGHARLLPVAAGAGAGIALGPLVALMALSIGSEMLARHQQDKKLDALGRGVTALRLAAEETTSAELDGAEQAFQQSSAAILDRITVPSAIGLGSARNDVRVIKNRALRWLEGWEQRVADMKSGKTGVDLSDMREVLVGKGQAADYRMFPRQVATLYRALALDSRAIVLTGAEAALSQKDFVLENLQDELRHSLESNAAVQNRLRELLWKLASEPVIAKLPARPDTIRRVADLQRSLSALAVAASRTPDAPGLLTGGNQQVVELLATRNSSLRVLRPPVPTA